MLRIRRGVLCEHPWIPFPHTFKYRMLKLHSLTISLAILCRFFHRLPQHFIHEHEFEQNFATLFISLYLISIFFCGFSSSFKLKVPLTISIYKAIISSAQNAKTKKNKSEVKEVKQTKKYMYECVWICLQCALSAT